MRTTILSILIAAAMSFAGTSVQADDNQALNTDQLIAATFSSLSAIDDSNAYEALDAECEAEDGSPALCDEPMDYIEDDVTFL